MPAERVMELRSPYGHDMLITMGCRPRLRVSRWEMR